MSKSPKNGIFLEDIKKFYGENYVSPLIEFVNHFLIKKVETIKLININSVTSINK